jgi:NADH:ubiquinone oxidoreductase subunit 3 (subunit A)
VPSSWNIYYVVFLSALLALGVPAFLAVMSRIVASQRSGEHPVSRATPINRSVLGRRINARFFLGVNAALILITISLALIPVAGMLRPDAGVSTFSHALIAIISLALFSCLGLFYSSRKGDLSWIKSYQRERK